MERYCGNCGAKMNSNDRFCGVCGTKLENDLQPNNLVDEKKGKSKKTFAIASGIMVVLLIFASVIFINTRPAKIELGDFLLGTPVYYGVDGHASFDAEELIDEDAFYMEIATCIVELEKKSLEDFGYQASGEDFLDQLLYEYGYYQKYEDALEIVFEHLNYKGYVNGEEVEEFENLKNGDSIKFTLSYENEKENPYFPIEIKDGTIEFKVEGLGEGTELTVFNHKKFKITCSGASGHGQITCTDSDELDLPVYVDYDIENNGYLKNGDKVSIELYYDDYELDENGYYFDRYVLEYEVTGLGEYVTSYSQLPEKYIEAVKELAFEQWEEESDWIETEGVVLDSVYFGIGEETNELIFVGKYYDEEWEEDLYCISIVNDLVLYPDDVIQTGGYAIDELEQCMNTSADNYEEDVMYVVEDGYGYNYEKVEL